LPEQKTEAELIKFEGRIPIFVRLLLTVLVIVIITELIGTKTINVGIANIVLLPMLYAVVIGVLITPDVLGKSITALQNIINSEEIALAGPLVTLALLPLGVKYGLLVGPAIGKVVQAGPAFILQEFGRKMKITGQSQDVFKEEMRKAARFAFVVLLIVCFCSAYIALLDPFTGANLRGMLGLSFEVTKTHIRFVIIFGGAGLLLLQHVLLMTAGRMAYENIS
jgi:hypothetical protein